MQISSDTLREETGLLQRPHARLTPLLIIGACGMLLIASALIGYAAGNVHHRSRLLAFETAAYELTAAPLRGNLKQRLRDLQELRAAVARNASARLTMARTYLVVAEYMPRRRPYLEEAFGEIQAAARLSDSQTMTPDLTFTLAESEAMILQELGQDLEARAALDRAETALGAPPPAPLRLHMDNIRAYLLSTAEDPRVRDPQKALALAKDFIKREVSAEDGRYPSQVAAYVDTLASAYFAAGNAKEALAAQTLALALAETPLHAVYLKHYDTYAAAAGR